MTNAFNSSFQVGYRRHFIYALIEFGVYRHINMNIQTCSADVLDFNNRVQDKKKRETLTQEELFSARRKLDVDSKNNLK